METDRILKELENISKLPQFGTEEYVKYLEQNDFLQFLLNSSSYNIPIYCSSKAGFIYSVILPSKLLVNDYRKDLLNWQVSPSESWGYGYGYSKRGISKPYISKPFDRNQLKILEKAQPITYLRIFEANIGRNGYIEISQFLTHILGLHYIDEKKAYCKLNKEGDIEEIIKIMYPQENGYLVTIKQNELDFHLFLNRAVLVRFFDRVIYSKDNGFAHGEQKKSDLNDEANEIYARRGIIYNNNNLATSSWIRGLQIIRNKQPRKIMVARLTGKELVPKKYETFVIYDFKHKRIVESSCSPHEMASYFVKSDKPFQTSPVFFKPDVLLKYKQDPEKYTLEQYHIACRNSWYLQKYDVNEAGQVFTYLCYLGDLPYTEQLHWKQYNEKPKAGISNRALKTDFEADWDLSYEPLSELKYSLKELSTIKSDFWNCQDVNLYLQLNYVVSDSIKEWSDEIQTLDKLVIEGLNISYIEKWGKSLKCSNIGLGSIKLLREILKAINISTEEIEQIIFPLQEIRLLRTKFSAHVSTTEKQQLRKEIISEHGTLKSHFQDLVKRTDKSTKLLIEIIKNSSSDESSDE